VIVTSLSNPGTFVKTRERPLGMFPISKSSCTYKYIQLFSTFHFGNSSLLTRGCVKVKNHGSHEQLIFHSLTMPTSDGKVRFSSVQRGISLNLEPNSRFGSRHFAEPWTGPTVQVRFWFEPVRTFGAWEKYFRPLFQSKSLENVNIYLIYLILDRGRLFCYDFCLTNGCWLSCELWVMVCGSSGTPF